MEKKRHWREEEVNIFFESLIKYGRNWEKIASCIPSKVGEQVRSYYYRLIRKLEKFLNRVTFTFDKKDRTDTWIALLCYWELRKDNNFEETSPEFAKEFKERISKQREALISTRNSVLQNTSDQLTLKILPRTKAIEDILKSSGLETEISVTIKTRKPISSLLRHPLEKYYNLMVQHFGLGCFHLYPHQVLNHFGWGPEDSQTTAYFVYNSLGCPQEFILDYDFIAEPYGTLYSGTPYAQNMYYGNSMNQPMFQNYGKYPTSQIPLPYNIYPNQDEMESYMNPNMYPWPVGNSVFGNQQDLSQLSFTGGVDLNGKNEILMDNGNEQKKSKNTQAKPEPKKPNKLEPEEEYEIYFDDKEIEADLGVLLELSLSSHNFLGHNGGQNKEDKLTEEPMKGDYIEMKNDIHGHDKERSYTSLDNLDELDKKIDTEVSQKEKSKKRKVDSQSELEGFYESSGFMPFKSQLNNINKKRKYNT